MLRKDLAYLSLAAALVAVPAIAQTTAPATHTPAATAPSATAPSTAPAATATTATTGTSTWMTEERDTWRASKLKGLNVYNANDEKLGDINELLLDHDGRVKAVVIGVGGFLGMGEHDVAVPFNDLKFVDAPRTASAAPATTTTTNPPATNPPAATSSGMTTGSTAPATRTTAATTHRWYPDHAVLNMTKDQLKAAPQFKYSR